MKLAKAIVVISFVSLALPAAAQTTLVSNLGEATSNFATTDGSAALGQSFTTDATQWQLTSIQVRGMDNGTPTTHHFSIYSDAAGVPGTELLQLDGTFVNTDTATTVTLTPPGPPLILDANTTYWLVLTVETTLADAQWAYSGTNNKTGPGTFGPYALIISGTWQATADTPQIMGVFGFSGVPVELQSLRIE